MTMTACSPTSRPSSSGAAPGLRAAKYRRSRWIVAWLGGAAIGVANGVAREATYGRRVSERTARQLSGLTAIGAFAAYFWALERRWPIPTGAEAANIGAAWVALTVAFEFSFGRLVANQSWDELASDYNLAQGRTWPLVLAWIGIGPSVVRRLQRGIPIDD
jgi:hypothetical protein